MAFLQPANIPSRNDVPARLQTVAKCETLAITYSGEGIMSALGRIPRFD